jgi:hypothetical protein
VVYYIDMAIKAGPVWLIMGVGIAAYDWWAITYGHETMSGAFWRQLDRHPTRIPVLVGATMLYKHLVAPGVLPQADPLKYVADNWHKRAKV